MVKIKYLKGSYSDMEIINLINSDKRFTKGLKTIGNMKSFGRMLQAKLSVKDLTPDQVISLIKNIP